MKMNVSDWLASLQGKKLIVLGLGVSNRPLVRLLLEAGCTVLGCDATPYEKLDDEVLELERLGCTLQVGENYLQNLQGDLIFRTPGLHPGRPELANIPKEKLTSEMEAFFALCPCPILAVTGSDGKTTTTTLIAKMLEQEGYRVYLGGNIGTPLLPLVEKMQSTDMAVVELSSFQLMDFRYSPHVAVVTNLAPNHLDIHRDMAEYVEAKEQIYLHQTPADTLIVNRDNAITHSFAEKAPGRCLEFSRQSVPQKGAFVRDGVLYWTENGVETRLFSQEDILLPGVHNVENYLAAICAVWGLVSPENIRKVALAFAGVEHRIELVRTVRGVKYYNDSIASSPSRTIAGLRSFKEKVILIAGGYDKKVPYDVLGPEICAHVKTLVLNGATAEKIREAVVKAGDAPETYMEPDFTAAVEKAASLAKPGDIVLMSPASAAFDQFKNFMVRGNYFKELVKKL